MSDRHEHVRVYSLEGVSFRGEAGDVLAKGILRTAESAVFCCGRVLPIHPDVRAWLERQSIGAVGSASPNIRPQPLG